MTVQDETYQFFVQESLDLLQTLESGLLNLRQNAHPKQFHNLMRAAHSLKGGAACVGLTEIAELAHNLENVFSALMQLRPEVDVDLEELLLQAFDTLKSPLLHQIHGEPVGADSAVATLQPILSRLEQKLGCNLAQVEEDFELPGMEIEDDDDSGLPEQDMTQMLLAEEIHQGITRWESLLHSPEHGSALGEDLISQAEVLATIGQLVNMAQIAAIAQTALQAIQANPTQAKTIGHLALADFRLAQRSGGQSPLTFQPNPQLLKLTRPVAGNSVSSNPLQVPNGNGKVASSASATASATAVVSRLATTSPPETKPATPVKSSPVPNTAVKSSPTPVSPVKTSPPTTAPVKSSPVTNTPVTNTSVNSSKPIASPPQTSPQIPPKSTPSPTPDPSLPLVSPETVSEEMSPSPSNLGIRVDLERLELLNNLVGELVTQENTFLLQYQQHQDILNTVQQKLNRLQKLNRSLQFWALKTAQPVWDTASGTAVSLYTSPKIWSSSVYARSGLRHGMRSEYSLHDLLQTVFEEMAQIEETLQDLTLTHSSAQPLLKKRAKSLKQLQTNLQQARMMPIGNLLHRFGRMVRDLSIKNNKPVDLQLVGEKTLVDKVVLERLYDPLVHLVRNAFDHGIESANLRQATGKPQAGKITIRAYHRGNSTYVEVTDDGSGIDHEKVRQTLVNRQLLSKEAAAKLSPESLQQYLFAPGFSTSSTVTELSGRGFGLELVQRAVEMLKGDLKVRSVLGQGTTFRLCLPFSLTVERLLVFSIESRLLAIPLTSLLGVAAVPESQIEQHQGQAFYQWRGYKIPVRSIRTPLGSSPSLLSGYRYPGHVQEGERLNQMVGNRPSLWQQSGKVNLLFISQANDLQKGASVIALPIDQVLMEQDLVIKPFSSTLTPPPYFYGCTVLGDGRLVPVVDAIALTNPQDLLTTAQPLKTPPLAPAATPAPATQTPTILVIDDSPTMRKTLSVTLTKGHYQVVQARQGLEALDQLHQNPGINAIICDLEMPQMNGFEFLSRYRQEFAHQPRPILMMTSRSSEKYRQQAFKLGATDYLSKPYLDRELLQRVAEVLGSPT